VNEERQGGWKVVKSKDVDLRRGKLDVGWDLEKQLVEKEWSAEFDLKGWLGRRLGRKRRKA
jgi:hypothetical protein